MDCCDEVETELEAFSTVSVFVSDDAESLEFSDDIFDAYACFCKQRVIEFILFCEWVMLAFLLWQQRVFDKSLYALIAGIHQQPAPFREADSGLSKEFEVVRLAFTAGSADDFVCLQINQYLLF